MKILLSALLVLSATWCDAQNYACIQSDSTHYFTNGNSYLRGIRIDSVKTTGLSTTYYPYKTIRGACPPSASGPAPSTVAGSWLGEQIIQQPDGTFIFDNYLHDSTVIRTQADVGDSWVFYSDSGSLYYKATLISKGAIPVLGTSDSIKTIRIDAYDTAGIVPTDPITGYELIISKNHGFVQIFDLYMFPYHAPDTVHAPYTDYYYEVCGSQIFSLIRFENMLMTDIYNYSTGDVNNYQTWKSSGMYYFTDSIISISAVSPVTNKVVYGRNSVEFFAGGMPPVYTSTKDSLYIHSVPVFPNNVMPEQAGETSIYYYTPNDTSFCHRSSVYSISSGLLFNTFEPCGTNVTYKAGPGTTIYSVCHDPTPGNSEYTQLMQCRMSGITCARNNTVVNSVANVNSAKTFKIYPQPATSVITVELPPNSIVTIFNIAGKIEAVHKCHGGNATIDISTYTPGIYLVNVPGYAIQSFIKQ